jgi:hypothetical protein
VGVQFYVHHAVVPVMSHRPLALVREKPCLQYMIPRRA